METQDLKRKQGDPRALSPVALAFIGDGVFELLVRERLVEDGAQPAHILHHKAVKRVNAAAQAAAYDAVEAVLSETERSILKRGRNAHTSAVPKSCTPEQYRKATAIEALFGYLYLGGEMERIGEIYRVVEAALPQG